MSTFHEEDICFKSEHQPDGEQSPGLWWLRWCNSLDCSVRLSFVPRLLFNKHITHLSTYHTQRPCLLFSDPSWHFLWGDCCWPFRSVSFLKPSVVVLIPGQSLLCVIPDTSVHSALASPHLGVFLEPSGLARTPPADAGPSEPGWPSPGAGLVAWAWASGDFGTGSPLSLVLIVAPVNLSWILTLWKCCSTLKDRTVKIPPDNQCYIVVIKFCLMGWSWDAFWTIHCVGLLFFVFV